MNLAAQIEKMELLFVFFKCISYDCYAIAAGAYGYPNITYHIARYQSI